MIVNTKCECGHQNPVGTVLCEACGKPTSNEISTSTLEMRYDGIARRSQRANPTWIDKVWNFFSSVKVAVYLILITLCCSILGTIYPQESSFLNIDPDVFDPRNYGTAGHIYYVLGLSRTYESWWFITLLIMIGTSLVVCSLDRVLPLYRALNKQQIRKHLQFIHRQKAVYTAQIVADQTDEKAATQWVEQFSKMVKKRRYRVHLEGTALLAEKNRFSRWGPYINHIGLIIFLLAVLLRTLPGWQMDEYMAVMEGETKRIEGTNFFIKNEKFTVDYYEPDEMSEGFRAKGVTVPKLFETKAVLYTCSANCEGQSLDEPVLHEVVRHNIIVNEPLKYKGMKAYQFDYRVTPQVKSVHAYLKNKQTGESYGSFLLTMRNPEPIYQVGPYQLEITDYYPEFSLNDAGEPTTLSRETPNTPAFFFLITGPELPDEGAVYVYFPREVDKVNFRQDDINKKLGEFSDLFEIGVESMDDVEIINYTTYLNIREDKAIPYIFAGGMISMLGLILGFYWQHRRIWLRVDNGQLSLGGHTNKNWFGLRSDIAKSLGKMGIEIEPKSLDRGGNYQ